jgi:uncharacterized protein YbjT (DUF2867 family)
VQIVEGDLRDASSFDKVLTDISAIICSASAMPLSYIPDENDLQNVDLDGMRNFIKHAKNKSIKRLIYISFSANINLEFPLRNAKRATEHYLKNSGMVYTILRPSYFMETWLSPAAGFDPEEGKVQIFGEGNQPISFISFKDVASFAIDSLTNIITRNATLELGGPNKFSQLDVVKIFEKTAQKKFDLEFIPENILKAKMNSTADPMQKSLAGLMLCAAHGDPIDMDEMLEKFQICLTSVKDYARHYETVA